MMCNVKGVASNDEPTENYHQSADLLSFTELFSTFQVTVLVWCGFTALINLVSSSRQLSSVRKL